MCQFDMTPLFPLLFFLVHVFFFHNAAFEMLNDKKSGHTESYSTLNMSKGKHSGPGKGAMTL